MFYCPMSANSRILAERLRVLEARVAALERMTGSSTNSKSERALEKLGWTPEEAQATRARLASFAEDWEMPEMDLYDHD
ncbi:MAG: hypothetical protein ACOCWF_05995 [Halochromatium sp.]